MGRLRRVANVLRAGLALPAATAACSLASTSVVMLVAVIGRPRGTGDIAAGIAFMLMVTFAYTLAVGVPIALSLRHRKRFNAVTMTLAGAGAGACFGALLALVMYDAGSAWTALAAVVALPACAGALGAWTFERVCRLFEGAASS